MRLNEWSPKGLPMSFLVHWRARCKPWVLGRERQTSFWKQRELITCTRAHIEVCPLCWKASEACLQCLRWGACWGRGQGHYPLATWEWPTDSRSCLRGWELAYCSCAPVSRWKQESCQTQALQIFSPRTFCSLGKNIAVCFVPDLLWTCNDQTLCQLRNKSDLRTNSF